MKIDVRNDSGIAGGLLDDASVRRRTIRCKRKGSTVFAQGSPATSVYCIVSGAVKLSIVSPNGREAVVALLESADFFGEGCLAGQKVRTSSAVALMPTTLWRIAKSDMERALRDVDFSQRFLTYMLRRNIRIEEDLVNQLFNSTEKRLARTLLLLAENDESATTEGKIARVPQGTLAELVGTTRPRVNHFLNKFRKLGLIEYNGGLKVNKALLANVLARE